MTPETLCREELSCFEKTSWVFSVIIREIYLNSTLKQNGNKQKCPRVKTAVIHLIDGRGFRPPYLKRETRCAVICVTFVQGRKT